MTAVVFRFGFQPRRRVSAFSRRRLRPSYWKRTALETEEGAGKAGCPPHPWSACNKKHAAEPQVQAGHPAFPAQWFYGLYVISPVTIAWLPPSPVRRASVFTTLAPASERQDHTTSPSAQTPLVAQVNRARRCTSIASHSQRP